jgi:hypothetical protein
MSLRLVRSTAVLTACRAHNPPRRYLCASSSSSTDTSLAPDLHLGHALDPSLQTLLQDSNLALLKSRRSRAERASLKESPVYHEASLASESTEAEVLTLLDDSNAWHNRSEKRSPEATLGSGHLEYSILPYELENAIVSIIGGSCLPSRLLIPNDTIFLVFCRVRQASTAVRRQATFPESNIANLTLLG